MDPTARVNGVSSFQTISGPKGLALTPKSAVLAEPSVEAPTPRGPKSSDLRLAKAFSQKDLNFRRLLETHGMAQKILERVNAHPVCKGQSLRAGTIVDATIIAARSSTKNKDGERDPEMHQTNEVQPAALRDEDAHRRGRRVRLGVSLRSARRPTWRA